MFGLNVPCYYLIRLIVIMPVSKGFIVTNGVIIVPPGETVAVSTYRRIYTIHNMHYIIIQ